MATRMALRSPLRLALARSHRGFQQSTPQEVTKVQTRQPRTLFDRMKVSVHLNRNHSSSGKHGIVLKCWKCDHKFAHHDPLHQCSKCTAIRGPPKNLDFFAAFGLEKSFDVDLKQLSQSYKDLQRSLHPDRFASRSSEEQSISEEWSPMINDGYKIISKPLLRAMYLLEIFGHPLEEGDIDVEPAFLAEIMEINEEIAEAETKDEVIELTRANKEALDQYVQSVSEAFRKDDYAEAKRLVAKMKYYSNIFDKLIELETRMGIVH